MRLLGIVFVLLFVFSHPSALFAEDFESERNEAIQLYTEGRHEEFAKIIERLCQKGDVSSQNLYGNYLWRIGNLKEAESWLLSAAQTGNAQYQFDLGKFYLAKSPTRNNIEAMKWIKLSSEQGNSRAKYLLSTLAAPPKPPASRNGKIDTKELADYSYVMAKSAIASSEESLACYKANQENLDSIFGPGAEKCKERAIHDHGRFVRANQEEILAFFRSYNACVRSFALEVQGISEIQLLDCTKNIR